MLKTLYNTSRPGHLHAYISEKIEKYISGKQRWNKISKNLELYIQVGLSGHYTSIKLFLLPQFGSTTAGLIVVHSKDILTHAVDKNTITFISMCTAFSLCLLIPSLISLVGQPCISCHSSSSPSLTVGDGNSDEMNNIAINCCTLASSVR